ncbi:MAG TPA: M50 family metallopeptidase [Alphaproteobacteria bacterium]|jgi:regulator of sigma E protease|nr:M50 family metallopeptidase [Alphaproteobacteria bacterium]
MLVSILVFLLVLSILVIVHEFGHFITAVKLGIPVLEFGFGLPPRIWGKKIGNTLFSLNALPFGGFVRLLGENEEEEGDKSQQFINKPKRIRIAVIVAGVVMNFLLAILAFAIVYSFSGIPKDTHKLKIVDVSAGSPAQVAGVIVGDVISKVGKDNVDSVDYFISKVNDQKGKTTNFEIVRNDNIVKLQMKPRENPPAGEGALGVTITTTEIYFAPVWQRPFIGIYYGFKEAVFWGKTILMGLWTMVYGLFQGQVPKGVSGPVGIFAVTSEAAKNGVLTLINFIGILSVNLAILNILPFPALDGGRLLFIFIEMLMGRKVLPKVEAITHTIGMIILLTLLVAITFHDVVGLIRAGSIAGFLNSMQK